MGYRFLFGIRQGVCFDQACLLNFSYNRVQESEHQYIYGEHSADDLLSEYEQGKRLDIASSFGMSHSACHIVNEPTLVAAEA